MVDGSRFKKSLGCIDGSRKNKTFGKGHGGKIKYTSWKGKPSLGCTHGARKIKYRRRNKPKVPKWDSEFEWKLLLEHDYSHFFDASCNKYDHQLDTVLDGLNIIKLGEDEWAKKEYEDKFVSTHASPSHLTIDIPGGYTALEFDLFVPKGYYTNKRDDLLHLHITYQHRARHLSVLSCPQKGDLHMFHKINNESGQCGQKLAGKSNGMAVHITFF